MKEGAGVTPDQLTNIQHGLCHYVAERRFVARRGKEPINPLTGYGAKANDTTTWGTLEQALVAVEKYSLDGIGIELGGGLCGIDIDHVIDKNTGTVFEDALRIVKQLDSYTEISPSGTGLHIFLYGDIPENGRKHTKRGIEIYKAQRYFTLTGNSFGPVRPIQHRQQELMALYNELFSNNGLQVLRKTPGEVPQVNKNYLKIGLEKDSKFNSLWNGERQFSDESSNDIAFMNKLAYWCNCDTDSMKAAFLSSPYAQQKDDAHWKKAADRQDYLQRTAARVAQDCQKTAAQSESEYKAARLEQAMQKFSFTVQTDKFINPIGSPEALKRYTLDDLGTARLFSDTFRDKILYLPEYKNYWVYRDGVWEQDKSDLMARQLAKVMADYVREIIPLPPPKPQQSEEFDPLIKEKEKDKREIYRKHYGKYRSLGYRKTLIQDAQDELRGRAADFDREPFLFNVKNGTLNLETMQLQRHDPADRLSKMANVIYDPAAKSERFERFIMEITESNQERADMLQKALGYCLKGEANEECYFTAIGEKTRNGKGTLFDTVLNSFGGYGAQMDFNTISRSGAKDGSRATPDVARLIGIRFVLANEPEKGVCVNEALLKQITGNDDITARPLYGDLIEFKPVFKLFVTANSKPTVSDDSLFTSNRIKLLPFTRHFSGDERDANLKSSFRTEESKSGIFNWILEGYKLYLAEGLKDTAEMKSLTAEYRRENDYIGLYLDDRVDLETGRTSTIKALRCDYANWCEVIGTKPLGLKMFKEELQKHNIPVKNIHKQYCIDGVIKSGYDYTGENAI